MTFFGEEKRNRQVSILYIIARKKWDGGGGMGVLGRFCFGSDSLLVKKKSGSFHSFR